MTRVRFGLCLACLVAMTSVAMGQEHRIFVQEAGVSPVGVPPEGIVIEVTDANALVVLDVYIEQAPPGQRFNATQVTMPCSVSCSGAGSVNFTPPVTYDDERADFCFRGRYCLTGSNVGLPCTSAADCPGGTGNPCPSNQSPNPVTDDGACSGAAPRAGVYRGFTQPAIVLTDPCNFSRFSYTVSVDASGSCVLTIPNVPDSVSHNQNDQPIPFITSGVTFEVPSGKCCLGGTCAGVMNAIACNNMGGQFGVNQTCADPCCLESAECDDDNSCTFDSCQSAACESQEGPYGDVNGSGGIVDLQDILCIINGFSSIANCPGGDIDPCTGDDSIALDDILKVLAAFAGADPCGCN